MATVFEKLGGASAIDKAVDIFYRKILADKRVNSFFDNTDMDKQIAKQKAFLTMVFGGPNHYSGKDLSKGHQHLLEKGLNDSHVDIVIEHLGATLKELGVAEEDIHAAAAIAEGARKDVLSRNRN